MINKITEKRMKDPVEGTLKVTGATMANPDATTENYRIDGVLVADGFPATPIVHKGMTSTAHWPTPGDELPVTFDRAKPERLVIHWDRVRSGRQIAISQAQALADQLNSGSTPGQPTVIHGTPQTTTITVNGVDVAGGGDLASLIQAAVAGATGDAPAPTPVSASPPVVSAADILARGVAGLGSLTQVVPTGDTTTKPGHTMIGLSLTVMLPGQAPTSVTNLYAVPDAKVAACTVGKALPVKVDPSMPGAVAIDWDDVSG